MTSGFVTRFLSLYDVFVATYCYSHNKIEGKFQVFQRLSSTKLVFQSVKSRFAVLNCLWEWQCTNFSDLQKNSRSLVFRFFNGFRAVNCCQNRWKAVAWPWVTLQAGVHINSLNCHIFTASRTRQPRAKCSAGIYLEFLQCWDPQRGVHYCLLMSLFPHSEFDHQSESGQNFDQIWL